MAEVPQADTAGFARADGPRKLVFPADFGPHPDFQTEWWYYTGNLETQDGQHFGYQLTFFRRAILPSNSVGVSLARSTLSRYSTTSMPCRCTAT